MATEQRDRATGALLFIPTQTELSTKANAIKLKQGLQDIEEMKKELKGLIESAKQK